MSCWEFSNRNCLFTLLVIGLTWIWTPSTNCRCEKFSKIHTKQTKSSCWVFSNKNLKLFVYITCNWTDLWHQCRRKGREECHPSSSWPGPWAGPGSCASTPQPAPPTNPAPRFRPVLLDFLHAPSTNLTPQQVTTRYCTNPYSLIPSMRHYKFLSCDINTQAAPPNQTCAP